MFVANGCVHAHSRLYTCLQWSFCILPILVDFVQVLGHSDTLTYDAWPEHDEAYLAEDAVKLPVQVQLVLLSSAPVYLLLYMLEGILLLHCGNSSSGCATSYMLRQLSLHRLMSFDACPLKHMALHICAL